MILSFVVYHSNRLIHIQLGIMDLHQLFCRINDTDEQSLSLTVLREALLAPAALYRIGSSLRNYAFDTGVLRPHRLPVPVISVGGLTVGGSGKTPVTRYLAERLVDLGYRPAILSRGYGRKERRPLLVTPNQTWREVGDEPLLLATGLPGVPVVVGPDRVLTGLLATQTLGADSLLMDDGFQHRRIERAIDIVVIDAAHSVGNGRLLPAGPLRESVHSLSRAHAVFLTRVDQAESTENVRKFVEQHSSGLPIIETAYLPTRLVRLVDAEAIPLSTLNGQRTVTLSGVANPRSFEQTLETLGVTVVGTARYPDHHPFTTVDLERVCRLAQEHKAAWIVTTEKDAMRLPSVPLPTDLTRLDIALVLRSGETELKNLLLTCGLSGTR